MAGILDFLSSPDYALGVGLLGAASSGKGFGGGLLDAVNYANSVKQHNEDRDLQKQYRNAQIQELQRKSLADARIQSFADAWFDGQPGAGAAPTQGAPGGQGGMPMVDGSSPQSQADQSAGRYAIERNDGGVSAVPQSALGGTGLLSAPMPQVGGAAASAPGGRMSRLRNFTRSIGIPDEVIGSYLATNNLKGIPELLAKASMPNWQNINGNLVNTNAPGFQGGFQSGMSTSANGQVTAWMPDGRGGLIVGAPQGALETYRAYQGVGADLKPIKVFNTATGREELTTEGNVARAANGAPSVSSSGYAGGSRDAATQEQIRMVQNELMRLPQNHPDVPALQREIKRLQGFGPRGEQSPPSGNYAAGPSAAESIANEAARVKAVKQTEADITPTAQKVTAVDTARDALSVIDQALNHPGLRTATGMSGTLDPRNYLAGTDATNFRVLLDQIKGGVFLDAYKDLRGGGAITEVEGQKAEAAKARINRAQSPDEFVKGLQEYRAIVDRGYERARRNLPAGSSGATGSWDDTSGGQQAAAPRATMRYNPQTGRLEKVN